MNLKLKLFFGLAAVFSTINIIWAAFQTPVLVSSDGKSVITCNERVIYIVDSNSLAVKKRLWAGGVVKKMGWGSDGKTLYVLDDANRLLKLAPGAEKLSKPITLNDKSKGNISPGFNCNKVALLQSWPESSLCFYSLEPSPKLIKSMSLPDEFKRCHVIFDDKGEKAILISKSQKFPEEKENVPEKPKKFDTKLAGEIFEEKTDGTGCWIKVLNLKTGKANGPFKVPTKFRKDGISKIFGDNITHIRYGNPCFTVSLKDGKTTFFMTPVFCNYGAGFFPNANGYMVGGLAKYGFCKNGKEPVSFDLPRDKRLPGWPEYFYGFAASKDGTIFGWTSGSRIVKISSDGKLVDLKPVF